MVRMYNCHPIVGQQVLHIPREPHLCAAGDRSLVVATDGALFGFTLGRTSYEAAGACGTVSPRVSVLAYGEKHDYVLTLEHGKEGSAVRAYLNWRCEEHTEVGSAGKVLYQVREIGSLSTTIHHQSAPLKRVIHVLEFPLKENPICLGSCPNTGNVIIGLAGKRVNIYSLVRLQLISTPHEKSEDLSTTENVKSGSVFENVRTRHQKNENPSKCKDGSLPKRLPNIDFELTASLHLAFSPCEVALCEGYVAAMSKGQIHIFHLGCQRSEGKANGVQRLTFGFNCHNKSDPDISLTLNPVLSRTFISGVGGKQTDSLHSLHLQPFYVKENDQRRLVALSCFFSQSREGFMYDLLDGGRLLTRYTYADNAKQAALCPHLLFVITSCTLECYTIRGIAMAIRRADPVVDGINTACPDPGLEVCSLRLQNFIGPQAICATARNVLLLTRADTAETVSFTTGHTSPSGMARINDRTTIQSWNMYALELAPPLHLYHELIEYMSQFKYVSPESSMHLLSEGHLLLRVALWRDNHPLSASSNSCSDDADLSVAFRDSCARFGDLYCCHGVEDWYLALPYYKMAGFHIADILARNKSSLQFDELTSLPLRKGLLRCLYHFTLQESSTDSLQQGMADFILSLFENSQPRALVALTACPAMAQASPAKVCHLLESLWDNNKVDKADTNAGNGLDALSCRLKIPGIFLDDHLRDDGGGGDSWRSSKGTKALLALTLTCWKLKFSTIVGEEEVFLCIDQEQIIQGILEEPRLLGCHTNLGHYLAMNFPKLLVRCLVQLHEKGSINCDVAKNILQGIIGIEDTLRDELLVAFWELLASICTNHTTISLITSCLAKVYLSHLQKPTGFPSLHTAQYLVESCKEVFGVIPKWLGIVLAKGDSMSDGDPMHAEDLEKLLCLLCGPIARTQCTILAEDSKVEGMLVVHVVVLAASGDFQKCRHLLSQHCPSALIPFSQHHFPHSTQVSFWTEMLVELCRMLQGDVPEGPRKEALLKALQGTLDVLSQRLDPLTLLQILPDEGRAAYFLPFLLSSCQNHYQA
uniref:BLOC-2 complex member HPS3 n=1 Tax=Myxine glutinosa TaxID=7769 RepID=UPI00358E9A25